MRHMPQDSDPDAPPLNPVPPVIWALVAALVLPELAFQLGEAGLAGGASAVGWRLEALNAYAFSPPLFDRALATGIWPGPDLLRLVAYPFVHLGFTHVLFVAVFLLALGKMTAEVLGAVPSLVIFFASAVAGAASYALILDDPLALAGGFPAVYGLIGAYTFVLWTGLGALGQNRARAFTLIGVLLGLQLAFGLMFGGDNQWVAEVTGFVTGFVLSFPLSPGGWARLSAAARRR